MSRETHFPIRYSLRPDQRKKVAAFLKSHGGATENQIEKLASSHGCAQKTIREMMITLKLPVKEGQRKRRDPMEESRALIEKVFEKQTDPTPPVDDGKEAQDTARVREDTALQIIADLETTIRREQEEAMAFLSGLEADLEVSRAETESVREKLRGEIEKTRQLRVDTRDDRERIEELQGNLSVQKRRAGNLKTHNERLRAELAAQVSANRELLEEVRELTRALSPADPPD